MESGPTHKVRLVRCPKCRMLLPEPPNIPVYKCGGCGTVLQAKNQKNNSNSTTSDSRRTEASQRNEPNHVSEVGESSSSRQKAVIPSSVKCYLDQNEGNDKKMSRYHCFEVGESSTSSQKAILPPSAGYSLDKSFGGDRKISKDHLSEGGESCSSSQEVILSSSAEFSLNQNGGDQTKSADYVSEGGESSISSPKGTLLSSGECSLDLTAGADQEISRDYVSESGESSSSSQKAILPSTGKYSLDKQLSRDFSAANSEDLNSPDAYQKNERVHNESQDCNIKQPGVSNGFCTSDGDANLENGKLSQLARANSEMELNAISLLHEGAKSAVDINSESDSTVRSSTSDIMARRENSTLSSRKLAAESFSSEILLSSPDEQPKQRELNVNLSYERREFFSPKSEASSKTEYYKAKSPRFRSSYEYDGSVSSYDGMDDQVPDQHVNLHKTTFMAANSLTSEELSRRDKLILGHSIMNGNSKVRFQANNLSSALPDTRPYTTDYRKWGTDELLGSTGHDLPVNNETRSQWPFYQRNPAGYESGSTSSPLRDEFHHSPGEQEKMKLLRMVYELQDRINKTCHVNEKADRRRTDISGNEKYIPPQYSGEIPEDEFVHDYHWRPERWTQVSNWPHHHKLSSITSSGEAIDNRQHMNYSGMQCYRQDSQCIEHLPPPFLSRNKGPRGFHFHHSHTGYNSYSSCPLSTQHFADSEFPKWHHETMSDCPRHEDHRMKEKHHMAKRHLCPTAGGAPFITCYNCLNPLQLPADFLVFKRRFHLLRCGACSRVLKFSLERRTHIVPYTTKAAAPSPSRLDDRNDGIDRRNLAPSRGNNCSSADAVSCSDDYGLSQCKSCSTDRDPVILAPLHNGQGNNGGRNLSYDSSESMKERPQFVRKHPRNKHKGPVEAQASPGPSLNESRSGKACSEIEELKARNSTLHRLMGYSSPSQVLKGSDPPSSGESSPYTQRNPRP